MEVPVLCAIISSTCSVIWIVNQICWYRIFKKHFSIQQKYIFSMNQNSLDHEVEAEKKLIKGNNYDVG